MSIKFYIPAFVWALVIFIIIAIPGVYIPKPHGAWELLSPDKIIHLAMFAPFSYLMMWGHQKRKGRKNNLFVAPLIIGTIYAISTEALQFYVVVGRNGNIYDAMADIIGVILGLIIFHKIND
ncbi:MAG: VanZ family protein [Bacteroidales bacterium]|nr:VanZ family protein [Bacteroidales bacterium]